MKAIAIKSEDTVYIFHAVQLEDSCRTIQLLEKYAKQEELPKGYSLRHDIARIPNCQNHIHVFRRRNQIGAFNMDGSPHDNSNFRIPRVVADYVQQHFPNFAIPDRRLVEASRLADTRILLLLKDVESGKNFEEILIIDLDEIRRIQPDDDQINLTKSLLNYLNQNNL